jgi:hypothetical protein
MSTPVQLSGVIADHFAALNAHDVDAMTATFSEDAYVNDACREFRGTEEIRNWIAKELVADHVTAVPTETFEHHGATFVRGSYDGDFDKAGLPDPIILTGTYQVEDDKIVTLFLLLNTEPKL